MLFLLLFSLFISITFPNCGFYILTNYILLNYKKSITIKPSSTQPTCASTVGFLSVAFSSPLIARAAQAPVLRTVAVAVLLETFLNSTNLCKHSWFPFGSFLIASDCASSSSSSASHRRCRGAPRNLPQLNQLVQAQLVSFRQLSHRYSRKKRAVAVGNSSCVSN